MALFDDNVNYSLIETQFVQIYPQYSAPPTPVLHSLQDIAEILNEWNPGPTSIIHSRRFNSSLTTSWWEPCAENKTYNVRQVKAGKWM